MQVSVRSLMFRTLIVQDMSFFDDMSTGELLSRMSNDVGAMLRPLGMLLSMFLTNIIFLFGGLGGCFYTSWRLSLLAFTTIAPIVYLTSEYAKWSRGINRNIWAALGSSTTIASQAFSNIRTVRSFGCEDKEINKFDNAMKEVLDRGIIDSITATLTFTLTSYLDLGAGVLILWFGGESIFNGKGGLDIGSLIAFQGYWQMMNGSYQGLQNIVTQFTRAAGAAQRVITLLDELPQVNLDDGEDPGLLDGNITIRDLYFSYTGRPETNVLNGINMAIKSGQVIAIVGRSGSGKTTLINLLMRFYDPQDGQILFNKNPLDLKNINLRLLRKQIGIVAQDTQLFDCSIEENIAYGVDGDYKLSDVIRVSKLANCHEFIDRFEEKYNTRIGERGIKLSGGQKQR